jgi:hypothetical protein
MKPATRPWLLVVAVVLLVGGWFAFAKVQGAREDAAAREAAVDGFEAQSGLKNVEVVRSRVDGDCALVELHHQAMKTGELSVALARIGGRWQVKRVELDDASSPGFDVDSAASKGCSAILQGD